MQSKQLPITNARDESAGHGEQGGYWRSIDQLDGNPEFEQFLHREFPQAASEFPEGVSRRRWLKLMSASLALGGAAGCRYGPNEIASQVIRTPNTVPGVPKQYATNFELAGRAVQLLVSNVDGRPIKADGNPDHPLMKATEPRDIAGEKKRFASAGTDVFSQACVLGLYDPDRAARVGKRVDGELSNSSWEEFAEYLKEHAPSLGKGGKLGILMSPSLSPTVNRLVGQIVKAFPEATLAQYQSTEDSYQRAAATTAAGKPAELHLNLGDAKVICCLDSDLLGNDANMAVYSRQFSKNREPVSGKMNRLYAVESRFSVTGSSADSRLALRSSQIGALLNRLEDRVDELLGGSTAATSSEDEAAFDKIDANEKLERIVEAMAEDLVKHKEHGVVSVGGHQPLDVQLAAMRLNKKLGNIGKTVLLMPSRASIDVAEVASLKDLASKIDSGKIDNVWILGDNPVYTSTGDVDLKSSLEGLDHVVYFAEFEDETAQVSSWTLPLANPLESWGDVLAADGTYGVCQPQILPLLGGKSIVDILAMIAGEEKTAEQLVQETVAATQGGGLSKRDWQKVLHDGFLPESASAPITEASIDDDVKPVGTLDLESVENGSLEVVFTTSDTLYDGRFAKNVWLQELPQAITKLVWDNAALVSPTTADKLNLKQGEMVKLVADGTELQVPVFLVPGHAAGSISLALGYGRVCRDEAVDSDEQVTIGQDVSQLRSTDAKFILTKVEARATGRPYKLATTQDHFAIDELGKQEVEKRAPRLVREGTLEKVEEHGQDYVKGLGIHSPPLKSLWDEPIDAFEKDETVEYQWGMTIDLNKCTGCNSCVVACQSENNISVVGKEQVSRGREMHWIRVDRYYRGERDAPQMVHQPMACAHCETAPCEQVCPVAATVHTEEGINAMAYNRCIGTRYCANNCPYKVRRFNYFNYTTEYGYFYGWQQKGKLEEASRKLQQLVLNPEVSVRGRGVMEKCTYCIQRVQNGKIESRRENRSIEDGEVQSACQAACPTQAITFGNINDENSEVSKLQHSPRAYDLLAELNIKPRTRYLARVRNTHPRLQTSDQRAEFVPHHGHDDHGEHEEGEHADGSHGDSHADGAHGEDHAAEAH